MSILDSRLLVLSVTMFVSFSCYSKWESFRVEGNFTEYFELESIKKINNFIYIWSMIDYETPQKDGILSTKYYSKYDCNLKRYKIISIIDYKTKKGRGRNFEYKKNLKNESSDSDWSYPSVESKDYSKIKFICGTQ